MLETNRNRLASEEDDTHVRHSDALVMTSVVLRRVRNCLSIIIIIIITMMYLDRI